MIPIGLGVGRPVIIGGMSDKPAPNREKPIDSPHGRQGLRVRRKALGLTLKQLAAAVPMDLSQLCRVERGTRWDGGRRRPNRPTPGTVARIEAALARLDSAGGGSS